MADGIFAGKHVGESINAIQSQFTIGCLALVVGFKFFNLRFERVHRFIIAK